MRKLLLLIPALLIAGIIYNGCQEQAVNPSNNSNKLDLINIDNSGEGCTPIYAGQNLVVGTICLEDDFNTNTLTVKYNITEPGWEITQIHFVVKDDQDDIPQTRKGNMIPGQFPYSESFTEGVTGYTLTIPFGDFDAEGCDDTKDYYAAAHCVVQLLDADDNVLQTETGWANGSITPGNNWGEIFSFQMECVPTEEDQTNETAFAFGCDNATCFSDIPDEDFTRWGWTNGPLSEYGTYYFDIYAAAGQCHITKGTLVGKLTVNYDGSTAIVTFNTCGNYTMKQTHLYVGNEILPRNVENEFTIAPGQFPYKHDFDPAVKTDTYEISVTGDIYVVAHAVINGDYSDGDCGTPGCEPPCDEWIIYGSNLTAGTNPLYDAIYAIDLKNKTRTLVYAPSTIIDAADNYPNGDAYDPVNQRIYFGTDDGRIFYYDIINDVLVQLTTNEDFGTMACGAWYNGKYYYVQNGSNDLYEVTITGTSANRIWVGDVPTSNGYGDIVFDPAHPGVFIGSAGSVWYAYNLNNGSSTTLTRSGGDSNHKQLAYASNGVLYAVNATTGQFYTVTYVWNADTQTVTLIQDWASGYSFTDLASGPQCQ